MFNQVQELLLKCVIYHMKLKLLKKTAKKFKKQLKEQREYFTEKIDNLEKENNQ